MRTRDYKGRLTQMRLVGAARLRSRPMEVNWLIYSMRRAKYESDQTQVMIKDLNTQKIVCASSDIDLSFGDFFVAFGGNFFHDCTVPRK